MNLPNFLTIMRIVVGAIVPFMMVHPEWIHPNTLNVRIWVAILFAIAAFSDWFDGWYARKYNLITKTGQILDPIADKVITIGSFIAFSDATYISLYSFWWLAPIIVREVGVTASRIYLLLKDRPMVVAASWSGKVKTVVQMLSLPFAYFYYMFMEYGDMDIQILYWSMFGMLLASVALTVNSGLRFFIKNRKKFED